MNKKEIFLEQVERQLFTEGSADLIRDELTDHIECLISDYEADGYTSEHAESKALLQMGDPAEIGYSFTDYDGMKKRKYFMYTLKITAVMSLLLTLIMMMASGISSPDGEFFAFVPSLLNFFNLWMIFAGSAMVFGHSMKFLEMDLTPYMIIWPVKSKFQWEYLALSVFFAPIVVLFFSLYFYEMGINTVSFIKLWPLMTIGYSVFAFVFSEKYRIPKYMIVKEGLIIKGRLLSWTGIKSHSWSKDFRSGDEGHYRLLLNCYGQTHMPFRKTIKVHYRQQNTLKAIMRGR